VVNISGGGKSVRSSLVPDFTLSRVRRASTFLHFNGVDEVRNAVQSEEQTHYAAPIKRAILAAGIATPDIHHHRKPYISRRRKHIRFPVSPRHLPNPARFPS
jgi:hypothetical protein